MPKRSARSRLTAVLVSLLTLSLGSPLAVAHEDENADQVSFADNSNEVEQILPAKNGFGFAGRLGGGFGIIYERMLVEKFRLQTEFFFGGEAKNVHSDFSKSQTVGAMDLKRGKHWSLSAGVDRFFFLTNDGRWALITGLVGSYFESEVQTVIYPVVCGLFDCGFDTSRPKLDKTEKDSGIGLLFRTGVRYSGIRLYGVKTDFSAVFVAQIARTPELQETTLPDGRRLKNKMNEGYLGFETVLGF